MDFLDKEVRREFCMVAALLVGVVALCFAGLNLSHNLGYWPHGQPLSSSAVATQDRSYKVAGGDDPWPGSGLMQLLIFALIIGSVLTVGVLYYRGRTASRPIKDLREGLTMALDLQSKFAEGNGKIHNIFSERITRLEEDRSKAIEERYSLGSAHTAIMQRLAGLDSQHHGVNTRFEEYRLWVSELEKSTNWIRKHSTAALEETPAFGLFVIEITHLISQLDAAIGILMHIKQYLPESETAKAPFSKKWCVAELLPKPDQLAIQWMLSIEDHLGACLAFVDAFDIAQTVILEQSLRLLASTWNQSTSMKECESILKNQRAKLTTARYDYAASLSARVAARAVIS